MILLILFLGCKKNLLISFNYFYQIRSSAANPIREGSSKALAFSGTTKSLNLCSIMTLRYSAIYGREIYELIHLDYPFVWSLVISKLEEADKRCCSLLWNFTFSLPGKVS